MRQKNCIAGQSGGPSVAINSSLAGVLQTVIESRGYGKVYGAVNGIRGVLDNNIMDLTEKAAADRGFVEHLKKTPSMYLGSCRHMLPDYREDSTPYKQIFERFEQYDIGAFFYIGGNDSMDTVMKLNKYAESIGSEVRIIGIPKTIDNDLCITDHAPGYGSAAKYVAAAMIEIGHDTSIYPINSVTVVEIMGRDAGWLAASSVLARNEYNKAPHLVYLPETPFSTEKFLEDVREQISIHHNVVVAVSEGIRDEKGQYISAGESVEDSFGHSKLSGAGKVLEHILSENLGIKVRTVEISILQRCAAHMSSLTDIAEAFRAGRHAVESAIKGETGRMVTIERISDSPYTTGMNCVPVEQIAGLEKKVPRVWINESGNDVTREFIDYAFPLIQGEPIVDYKNGLPVYLPIEHLIK